MSLSSSSRGVMSHSDTSILVLSLHPRLALTTVFFSVKNFRLKFFIHSHLPHACDMSSPFNMPWFCQSDIIRWRLQFLHSTLCSFLPYPCWRLPLPFKYPRQHLVLETLSICIIPFWWQTKFLCFSLSYLCFRLGNWHHKHTPKPCSIQFQSSLPFLAFLKTTLDINVNKGFPFQTILNRKCIRQIFYLPNFTIRFVWVHFT
jgi:hypothetical protein